VALLPRIRPPAGIAWPALGLAVTLVVLLAACSQEAPPSPVVEVGPTPAPIGSAPSVASASTSAVAPPTIDPAFARERTVTCGDGREFPAELLLGDGLAGNELEPASQALRQVITGPDGRGLPASGWHWVIRAPTVALFVAPEAAPSVGWQMVSLVNSAGGWTIDSTGSCRLTVVMPDGIGPARWWIDPGAGLPAAGATSVAGFLLEQSCASGRSPEGRVFGPVVDYHETSIVIRFGVRKRPGGQDCPGNPPFAVRFELDQPIAGRRLLDGSAFPPRDAAVVPD
jgi:hypothetical protein